MTRPAVRTARPGTVRSLVGGSVGNLVEWFDWYTYSIFAIYFSGRFFPASSAGAELLGAFAIFAAGFFARPVGGWLLGAFADRHGRRAGLSLTVLLMSVGSLGMALAPTYDQVGLAAPLILLVARLVQGFSVGGEFASSATFLVETAPPGRRNLFASFQYVSTTLGQLAALGLQLLLQAGLTEAQLTGWGWRIPFAVGAAGALVALWLRRGLAETEAYQRSRAAGRAGGGPLAALTQHPKRFALVVGVTLGGTVTYYTFTTYLKDYAVVSLGLSRADAALASLLALIVFALLQPVYGLLADRIGWRPLTVTALTGMALATVPIFTLVRPELGSLLAWWLLAVVLLSGYSAVSAAVLAELFPAGVRAAGIGLPYSLTVALFGGTAPYLALWLKGLGHERWFFWYVAGLAAVSAVVYLRLPAREGEEGRAG